MIEAVSLDKRDVEIDMIRRQYMRLQEQYQSGKASSDGEGQLLLELYSIQQQIEEIRTKLRSIASQQSTGLQQECDSENTVVGSVLQAAISQARQTGTLKYTVHAPIPSSADHKDELQQIQESVLAIRAFLSNIKDVCRKEDFKTIRTNLYILSPGFLDKMERDYVVSSKQDSFHHV